MQASDKQVRRLFKALAQGRSLRRAAMNADLSENTARDYAAPGQLPSERQVERTWRTHADAFEEDWPEIERRLAAAPTLRANTIFDDLVARFPGRYEPGQLWPLQRRVRLWRARSGPEKEVFFPQEHRPGEALQLDFTWASELGAKEASAIWTGAVWLAAEAKGLGLVDRVEALEVAVERVTAPLRAKAAKARLAGR